MLSIAAHLTLIIGRLGTAVSRFVALQGRAPRVVLLGTRYFTEEIRPSPHRPIPADTWNLLIRRVSRLAERFQTLVARWHAGAIAPPRPQAAAPAPRQDRAPYLRLPRERGWISKRVAEAGPCAGNLRDWSQQPELSRFLAEVPRAGRLLRPLCHALGLDPPQCLKLPPRPRAKRPPRPRKPPAFGRMPTDHPLPSYVRATVRAWKKRDT